MCVVSPFYHLSHSTLLPFLIRDLLSCLINEADISLNGAQKRIFDGEFTRQHTDREMQFNILLN